MNTETLQINIESPIATVTLNRPNVLNAFNEQLVLDLQQAFKSLTEDESVRVIILTGSGKGFSAGADLTEREASWDPDPNLLLFQLGQLLLKTLSLSR